MHVLLLFAWNTCCTGIDITSNLKAGQRTCVTVLNKFMTSDTSLSHCATICEIYKKKNIYYSLETHWTGKLDLNWKKRKKKKNKTGQVKIRRQQSTAQHESQGLQSGVCGDCVVEGKIIVDGLLKGLSNQNMKYFKRSIYPKPHPVFLLKSWHIFTSMCKPPDT